MTSEACREERLRDAYRYLIAIVGDGPDAPVGNLLRTAIECYGDARVAVEVTRLEAENRDLRQHRWPTLDEMRDRLAQDAQPVAGKEG